MKELKNEFNFDKNTYNKILENVFLTNEEKQIIKLWRDYHQEWTCERLAIELHISNASLYRKMKNITMKILKYQYSED